MSGLQITISSSMDLDQYSGGLSGQPSATIGMPLTTIPEHPFDEEEEDEQYNHSFENSYFNLQDNERVQAMFTNDTPFNEEINLKEEQQEEGSTTPGRSSNQQRLSINMSFLSPSTPPLYFSSSSSSSPLSTSSSFSSCSSTVSSPRSGTYPTFSTHHRHLHGGAPVAFSPILNPFQWTSDIRQYIMTDIGPQPSTCSSSLEFTSSPSSPGATGFKHQQQPYNQGTGSPRIPQLVRQRSYSKIGGPGFVSPASMSPMSSHPYGQSGWATTGAGGGGGLKGLGLSMSPTMPALETFTTARAATSATASTIVYGSSESGRRFDSMSMSNLDTIPQE